MITKKQLFDHLRTEFIGIESENYSSEETGDWNGIIGTQTTDHNIKKLVKLITKELDKQITLKYDNGKTIFGHLDILINIILEYGYLTSDFLE